MYDKDNGHFRLTVRDLNSGSTLSKPQVDRVSNLAWVMEGKALLYTVTNDIKRPYQLVIYRFGVYFYFTIFLIRH